MPGLLRDGARGLIDFRLDQVEFRLGDDQRRHDLRPHQFARPPLDLDGGLENRARLHLGDFRKGDSQPRAAKTQHRIDFAQIAEPAANFLGRHAEGLGDLVDLRRGLRQKFMQRRIEQADRHRQPGHDLEQLDKIAALHRQQLCERGATAGEIVGKDHLAHGGQPIALEEHMLGAAKADALRAEFPRRARIRRRLRVGAHLHAPHLVGPFHQYGEFARKFGLAHLDRALNHLPGAAVEGQHVAALEGDAGGRHRRAGVIDADRGGAGDAGLAHAARDDCRMRRHAAARRQHAFRRMHAVDVVRARLDAHEDDLAAHVLHLLGFVRREGDLAARRARRRRQAGRDDLARRGGIDRRMQQLVERGGIDPRDRLVAGDQALMRHVDRDAQRRDAGAFAGAGLQHP